MPWTSAPRGERRRLREFICKQTEDDQSPGNPRKKEYHETAMSSQPRHEQADYQVTESENNHNNRANDVQNNTLFDRMPRIHVDRRFGPDRSKRTTDIDE